MWRTDCGKVKVARHGPEQVNLVRACLPRGPSHGFSRDAFDLQLRDRIPTSEFRRWFHMPKSD